MNFQIFGQYPNLRYGLSQKVDGSMKLGITANANNRSWFFQSAGIVQTVAAEIKHGAMAARVYVPDAGKVMAGADGLITSERDLALTVTVADCFPVYIYDPATQTIALAHAGWRGIAAGIVKSILQGMNADPSEVKCGIGPGVQKHHFEIKDDVAGVFSAYPDCILRKNNLTFLDLPAVITRQLLALGLKSDNIETSGECTFCAKEKYFSFRRDHPEQVEAMAAYIGLV